ncbi:Dehydrogenase orsE [Pseudocercospora fuligena]|uniref:Dehydrogenase orsE n=1 Tax=Pseudocercospora fuligena TaxID=685502 RepID=A0A8H6REP2_9PEZI|nr:Dehydrogenase orsE [Pseudocercospora fuligena]
MQQHKAILVTEIGKPVSLGTRMTPKPSKDEVLVKVVSTMLLPHDAYGRDWGLLIGEKLPAAIGTNVGGIVEEVGSAVTEFSKGDEVFGLANELSEGNDQAGLQGYATLTATSITKKPASISLDEAVTLPVNLVTSFVALFTTEFGFGFPAPWVGDKENFDASKQTIVIIGGGAVVAKFGIQLAKLAGIGRIITIAGLNGKEELERMGATHVIDRQSSNEEITKQIHAITGQEGVTHLYDCRSLSFELAASLLPAQASSRLIALHPIEQAQAELLVEKSPNCSATFVENIHLGDDEKMFWQQVPKWLAEGSILPSKYRVVDGLDHVDEINAALDAYMLGAGGPQLIVRP